MSDPIPITPDSYVELLQVAQREPLRDYGSETHEWLRSLAPVEVYWQWTGPKRSPLGPQEDRFCLTCGAWYGPCRTRRGHKRHPHRARAKYEVHVQIGEAREA